MKNNSNAEYPSAELQAAWSAFHRIEIAIKKLLKVAVDLDANAADLTRRVGEDIPWWKWWQKLKLFYDIRKVNGKYKFFERQFLYEPGLDSRPWFKHVVFAPGLWTGYAGATFPGLVESIDMKDWPSVRVSF
jgi:N-acetylated-alpha-linked acidic dipeptidase